MAYFDCKLINPHDSEFVSQIQCPNDRIHALIEIAMASVYELLIYDYHD